jgi:lipoprotein-releasing system permease protein
MLYTVKLRTKEIGVLKAIGFSGKSIMAQFMTEGTIVGVIGGIVGIIIGIVNATTFSQFLLSKSTSNEMNIVSYGITNIGYGSDINSSLTPLVSIELVLFVLLASIGLSLLGSLYPAWQASRKSPMEAMRNE